MEESWDSTTPFLTIDPAISNRLESVYNALNGGDWKSMLEQDDELRIRLVSQGVPDPDDRTTMSWDDANLFFVSCIDLTRNGRPSHLEAGISKEKFGRFPYGDGSSLTYMREWIRESMREPEGFNEMSDLLEKLVTRMSGTSMEKGVGRLNIRGWLTNQEITLLRKRISSRCWTPSSEEPLDGGTQDAAKHLLALLRAAEKRNCGVLYRVHG